MAEVDGIWFSTTGVGPVVVVPRLNVDGTGIDLSVLTRRFRVVVVAPRGFGPSERPGGYSGESFIDDIKRVLEHLAIESFATFGYSMSGAMAARLAVADTRAVAAVCGGFPLTADLTAMGIRQRRRSDSAREDPAAWEELVKVYDPDAAIAFWDDVSDLSEARLVDPGCPVRAWWGADDTVITSLVEPAELERALTVRGIPYEVLAGLDHDSTLDSLDAVLPTVTGWLTDQFRRPRSHRGG